MGVWEKKEILIFSWIEKVVVEAQGILTIFIVGVIS